MTRRNIRERVIHETDVNYPPSIIFSQPPPVDADKSAKIEALTLLRDMPAKVAVSYRVRGMWVVIRPAPEHAFIREVDAYASASDPDDGIDFIYSEIDTLLRRADFMRVDRILMALNMHLPTVFLLAFLSITSSARQCLPGRTMLVRRVRDHLSATDPTRQRELLDGLE